MTSVRRHWVLSPFIFVSVCSLFVVCCRCLSPALFFSWYFFELEICETVDFEGILWLNYF